MDVLQSWQNATTGSLSWGVRANILGKAKWKLWSGLPSQPCPYLKPRFKKIITSQEEYQSMVCGSTATTSSQNRLEIRIYILTKWRVIPVHIQVEGALSSESISWLVHWKAQSILSGNQEAILSHSLALLALCIVTPCKQDLLNFVYTYSYLESFLKMFIFGPHLQSIK